MFLIYSKNIFMYIKKVKISKEADYEKVFKIFKNICVFDNDTANDNTNICNK